MKLTKENLEDIMVTALVGGINYWVRHVKISPDDQRKVRDNWNLFDAFANGIPLIIVESCEDNKEHIITPEMLSTGITKFKEIQGYSFDLEDFDSEGADTLIQITIFGELVYS